MRVLSIDVGIKNLALCVFDINDNVFLVDAWQTVNLLQSSTEQTEEKLCTCLLVPKNKKTQPKCCGKKAKYMDGQSAYCEKHAKLAEDKLIPTKQTTEPWWKKQPVADVAAEYTRIMGNSANGDKSRPPGRAVFDKCPTKNVMVQEIAKYYAQRTLIPIATPKTKSAKEVSLVDVGRAVKAALLPFASSIDRVVIENQISTIAARMKTIQGMIAQTFIMSDREIAIDFVSSSNKLKGLGRAFVEDESNKAGTKAKYNANKMDGVKLCTEFIANNPELAKWSEMFHVSKKKDDLADCFLQGIWYLKTQKYIAHADNLRINSVKIT